MGYIFFNRNSYHLCLLKYINLSSDDQLANSFESSSQEIRRITFILLLHDLVGIMNYMPGLVFNSEMTSLHYFVNH